MDEARPSERRGFTVTKFDRHPDGYLHARVTPSGGKAVYVHRAHGSWLAPGTVKGKAMLKEVVKDVAEELQKKARSFEKAEKKIWPVPLWTDEEVNDGRNNP